MCSKHKGPKKHDMLAAAAFGISALLCLLIPAAFAGDYSYETVYAGLLDKAPSIKSALIRSEAELDGDEAALGIGDAVPPVDFGKDALILITAERGTGGAIVIKSANLAAGGVLEVRYTDDLMGPPRGDGGRPGYAYLIARLSPAPLKSAEARFINVSYTSALAPGTGLGQFKEYTNVLSGEQNRALAKFFPLEKGNTWTYRADTDEGPSEVTNSVIAESDGWSVFDKFFGVSGVGMKISPGGQIYVASEGGIKTFYNSDVGTSFPKTGVKTPAGSFEDVMVVSVPEGRDFWFKDVYAKGVGLVYHEQRSKNGHAAYFLVRARVGGTEYPKSITSGGKGN